MNLAALMSEVGESLSSKAAVLSTGQDKNCFLLLPSRSASGRRGENSSKYSIQVLITPSVNLDF